MDHHAAVKTTVTSKCFWVWVHIAGGRWGGVTLFFAFFVGDHVGLFSTFNSHSFNTYKLAAYTCQTQGDTKTN